MKYESKRLAKDPSPFAMNGFFLAGGSILSKITKKEVSDYDYYPKSKEALINGIYSLLEDESCFIVGISDRAITLKSNRETNDAGERVIIQIITYDTFETAEKIFDNFDFTVCMAAFDCDTKEYHFHDDFFPDVASKTLRVNVNTKYPLNSLLRTTKYRKKGYYIPKTEQMKLGFAIAKKGIPESWEELESQIGGAYGRVISLNSNEMEYSFDNVIKLLDNMIFDFEHYERSQDEDLVKSISASNLELLFSDDVLYYKHIDNDKILLDKNGFIINVYSPNSLKSNTELYFEDLIKLYKKQIEEWPHDYIMGYKKVIKDGDNYYPGTRINKNFIYRLNEIKEETKHPYLFVFREKLSGSELGMNTYVDGKQYPLIAVEVKVNIEDIANLNDSTKAFTTKKLIITKELYDGK